MCEEVSKYSMSSSVPPVDEDVCIGPQQQKNMHGHQLAHLKQDSP